MEKADSWDTWLLTKETRPQRFPPLAGEQKHFLGKESNLIQVSSSFLETTDRITSASFLAVVALDWWGILFSILFGWLRKTLRESRLIGSNKLDG